MLVDHAKWMVRSGQYTGSVESYLKAICRDEETLAVAIALYDPDKTGVHCPRCGTEYKFQKHKMWYYCPNCGTEESFVNYNRRIIRDSKLQG